MGFSLKLFSQEAPSKKFGWDTSPKLFLIA